MARLKRYVVPGQPQHVIQRDNNRTRIFFLDDDHALFLDCLADAAERYELAVHAYVLMPNHIHLLATPAQEDSLARTMQSLGRRYVLHVNKRSRRTGTLWEGRYRATIIDSDAYLLACSRYIDLNPVRAGLVSDPRDYRWSGYRHLAYGDPDPLIAPHPLYLSLGPDQQHRRKSYRSLVRQSLDTRTIESIRRATNSGWALGDRGFRQRIAELSGRRTAPLPPAQRETLAEIGVVSSNASN